MKQLNEIFNGWLSGSGIFHFLETYDVPWKAMNVSAELDLDYHGNRSGQKLISPLVKALTNENTITENDGLKLASVVWARYRNEWTRLYGALFADYNPIENYSVTEEETSATSRTGNNTETLAGLESTEKTTSDNNTLTRQGTTETTGNNSYKRTGTNSIIDENKRSAYNSNTYDPETQMTRTETPNTTDTETIGNTVTVNNTDTDVRSHSYNKSDNRSEEKTESINETDNGNRRLTRSGNIGVTTSQQMLESEIELRKKNFFEIIYADLDKVLTIMIY